MARGKGTQSFGKRHTKVHSTCRRCGEKTYHIQKKTCSKCAYPNPRTRSYNWALKTRQRRGEGHGRMAHKRDVQRRAKNGFRHNTTPKAKPRNQS